MRFVAAALLRAVTEDPSGYARLPLADTRDDAPEEGDAADRSQ